jgi:CheY-like chemotaxis protein
MSALANKRILLVEDEALIALMLEEMLGELGVEVVASVGNLPDALDAAAAVVCDAAVLDVNLGGTPVFPAAERLGRRGIPIVFATGYGRAALEAGHPGQVIEKPYTREKLENALIAALDAGPGEGGPRAPA